LDFGYVEYTDPHFSLMNVPLYDVYGYEGCAKLVEAINRKSKTGPWVDMKRVFALSVIGMAGWPFAWKKTRQKNNCRCF